MNAMLHSCGRLFRAPLTHADVAAIALSSGMTRHRAAGACVRSWQRSTIRPAKKSALTATSVALACPAFTTLTFQNCEPITKNKLAKLVRSSGRMVGPFT